MTGFPKLLFLMQTYCKHSRDKVMNATKVHNQVTYIVVGMVSQLYI